jgi:hypothetical protein
MRKEGRMDGWKNGREKKRAGGERKGGVVPPQSKG